MEQKSTIFINPKFKNAYINPNFLMMSSTNNKIHVNPKFLNQQVSSSLVQPPPLPPPPVKVPEPPPITQSAIIKNTKRSLIRKPEKIESKIDPIQQRPQHPEHPVVVRKMQLIKISNTKLVNASHLMNKQQKENETIKKATESLIKAKNFQRKKAIGEKASIYKLDRTKGLDASAKKKQRKIIKQFSIKNVDQPNTQPTPKKRMSVVVANPKLLKMVNNIQQRDGKKYTMVLKKKAKPKKSSQEQQPAQPTEARYFDKDLNSSSTVVKNIPDRSKTAPTLPDFIKI